jgi:hypothetical protein
MEAVGSSVTSVNIHGIKECYFRQQKHLHASSFDSEPRDRKIHWYQWLFNFILQKRPVGVYRLVWGTKVNRCTVWITKVNRCTVWITKVNRCTLQKHLFLFAKEKNEILYSSKCSIFIATFFHAICCPCGQYPPNICNVDILYLNIKCKPAKLLYSFTVVTGTAKNGSIL